jgi:hypothetical protein
MVGVLAATAGLPSVIGARTAHASTFVELTVGDLSARATSILAGTPVERRAVWESTDGSHSQRIVTYTRVRVDRVVDGQPGAEVWVRTLGGQVEGIGQKVDGEAVLPMGRPALLFLAARADGTHGVVGMAQGHYPLETTTTPTGSAAIRVAQPTGLGRLLPKAGTPLPGRPAPARLVLPGLRLEDLAQLIAAERGASRGQ